MNYAGIFKDKEGNVYYPEIRKIRSNDIVYFTPTASTVSNYNGYGNCYYYKIGSRVHIHIGVKVDTTQSVTIYILPTQYLPITALGCVGIGASMSTYTTLQITERRRLNYMFFIWICID